MLKPSDFNNAVPQFSNGNYASNPINPKYVEEPSSTDYNRGTEPLQTLPAQWWNWFMNKFTSRFNKVNIYVKNLFNELAQLLSLVNVTPDGTEGAVTDGQLKNAFKELYPDYINTKLALKSTYVKKTQKVNNHALSGDVTVTKSDVGLGNVPNVSTNDQTPTYTEASTLSALSSGEKLSIAFGKLAKAVSSLISHINNTNNPHSVTKAQVQLGNVVNTGDSATPVENGTTKFTTGGAYNLLTSLAPIFSTSTFYAIGDMVTYNGRLYTCTTAHSAGAWNASHFTAVNLSSLYNELYNDINKPSIYYFSNPVATNKTIHLGSFSASTFEQYGVNITIEGTRADGSAKIEASVSNGSLYISVTSGSVNNIFLRMFKTDSTHADLYLEIASYMNSIYIKYTNKNRYTHDGSAVNSYTGTEVFPTYTLSSVAPTFNTSTSYTVGDMVTHDGILYTCTTAHSAGAWKQSHFTMSNLNTELAKKVDKTTTVNGHALSGNVTVTKADLSLDNVVNTGDSATPVSGGTTKFTTGGAYTELNKKFDKTSAGDQVTYSLSGNTLTITSLA